MKYPVVFALVAALSLPGCVASIMTADLKAQADQLKAQMPKEPPHPVEIRGTITTQRGTPAQLFGAVRKVLLANANIRNESPADGIIRAEAPIQGSTNVLVIVATITGKQAALSVQAPSSARGTETVLPEVYAGVKVALPDAAFAGS